MLKRVFDIGIEHCPHSMRLDGVSFKDRIKHLTAVWYALRPTKTRNIVAMVIFTSSNRDQYADISEIVLDTGAHFVDCLRLAAVAVEGMTSAVTLIQRFGSAANLKHSLERG